MLVAILTIVVVIPPLATFARFAFRDVLFTGDLAVVETRLRDLWSGSMILDGPLSTGFNHPGPLYFYVLAPLYGITGGHPWSMIVTGLLVHVGAVLWSVWLAWRRGGAVLGLLVVALVSLTNLAATERLFLDPWNPHLALGFFLVCVLQLWSVMVGDLWQLAPATIVGSFLAQSHIGYVPLVVAGFTVVLVTLVVDARREHDVGKSWHGPVLVSLALLMVCWLPPIIEQVTNSPGNFVRIARYFRSTPEPVIGLRDGIGTFAALYRPLPTWLGGSERYVPLTFQPRPASPAFLIVPAILLLVAYLLARRHRLQPECRLVVLVSAFTVVGLVGLSRLKQRAAWSYMSMWRIPLAVLILVIAAWTLWHALGEPGTLARTIVAGAATMAVVGGVVPITSDIVTTEHAASYHHDAAAAVRALSIDETTDEILVRSVAPSLRGVAAAIVNELDRDGVTVRVPPSGRLGWGSARVARPQQVDRVWVVTEDGARGALLRAAPGAKVLVHTSPLRAVDERELSQHQRAIARQLLDAGRPDLVGWLDHAVLVGLLPQQVPDLDPIAIDRVLRLTQAVSRSGRCRCTVVEFTPDELPDVARPNLRRTPSQ